ncbi:Uncharacterized protein M6B38_235330 [Iris pallida]|uniref:Uncharacterized protein n=1 Tax=Iris pallida TaxID=29817 RepID=A0AAX6DPM7_IRIPA|nr:Uncharacterized protein M6B38_235330 [Iris pallida]
MLVDKLKILAESLANSSSKAEVRIWDHRRQVEEALNFRVAKASEISETEKGVATEIAGLEKHRDKLEDELTQVNLSLKAAHIRLRKHREERNHFDEANNQIILQLKMKEDELSRSIASCKVEADVVHVWIKFLEDTWVLQSSWAELKEKKTNEELEKYGDCFMKLIKHHLLACKEELGPSIQNIKSLADSLKLLNERSGVMLTVGHDVSKESRSCKEQYLEAERMIIIAFSVVDHMKELIYTDEVHVSSRRDDPEVKELFDAIEKLRGEFRSIDRPSLNLGPLKEKVNSSERSAKSSPRANSPKPKGAESPKSTSATGRHLSYSESKLSKFEAEFYDTSSEWSAEDIVGWEFD